MTKRKIIQLISVSIISILIVSGCDIIDAIMGDDNKEDLSNQQEQALNTVVNLQDDASIIVENLFNGGLDTLAVIDSVAKFFKNDTSILAVWPDSEGVSVEYKNGIGGGIFLRRYVPEEATFSIPGAVDPIADDTDLTKPLYKTNSTVPVNKKSIYFDAAYPQFSESVDEIIQKANAGFMDVGITPFKVYHGSEATIEVLSTLDNYGIIHLGGHGWRKRKADGFAEDYVTYLMTGDNAEMNTTFGELWDDILEKNIIVAKDYHTGENKYWVSPKFVADRNDFSGKNTFIYGGFCYSMRRWPKEMVVNAGAKQYVGYKYQVKSNWEEFWAIKMYTKMCNVELINPTSIGDCINTVVNEPYGYHFYMNSKPVHMMRYNRDGSDLTFWKNELLDGRIEFNIEEAFFSRSNGSTITSDLNEVLYLNNASGSYGYKRFFGRFNYESLGRTFSGSVRVEWNTLSESIDIDLYNTMYYQSNLGFGKVTFDYSLHADNIPYQGTDPNNGYHIYSDSGSSGMTMSVSWYETNSQYTQHLMNYNIWGDDSFITVSINRNEN